MLCEMVNRRQHQALVCAPGKGWLLYLAFQILQHFFLIPDSHYNSNKWTGLAYCDPPSPGQDPKTRKATWFARALGGCWNCVLVSGPGPGLLLTRLCWLLVLAPWTSRSVFMPHLLC